jgi:hypothetical protein
VAVHYHILVTDGVFSPTDNDDAAFHAAIDFTQQDIVDLQSRMRARGLRFLERHGHLGRTAVDSMDAAEHAGGWSVDASVRIAEWDRQGLERLVRYCARPPLSADRLEQLKESTLVYRLRKPTLDGHTELILKPLELLERLSQLITPPRIHKHRYCGVLTAECTAAKCRDRFGRTGDRDADAATAGDRQDAVAGRREPCGCLKHRRRITE